MNEIITRSSKPVGHGKGKVVFGTNTHVNALETANACCYLLRLDGIHQRLGQSNFFDADHVKAIDAVTKNDFRLLVFTV